MSQPRLPTDLANQVNSPLRRQTIVLRHLYPNLRPIAHPNLPYRSRLTNT